MGNKYDFLDVFFGVLALCYTAYNVQITPFYAIPAFVAWYVLYWGRRTTLFQETIEKSKIPQRALPILLPPRSEETSLTLHQTAPFDVRVVNKETGLSSWFDRVTKETPAQGTPVARTTRNLQAIDATPEDKQTTKQNMHHALSVLPKLLMYNHPKIPNPPTSTSVLVGYDGLGKRMIWIDFGKYTGDTIHTFVAGQIGAGKDSLLRMWFTQLTMNNTPQDIQFVIIDAKGEWITPALKDSLHMLVPPVGGFDLQITRNDKGKRQLVDKANESIEDALINTIELLQERAALFSKVGATNIQAYEQKTGKELPLLFIIATDIGTNLQGILEELIKFVVLKGRSFGVRAIISFQSASGESTGWRSNMGMTISGFQGLSSADMPNMGIPVRAMKYRPSELPNVDVPDNRGLFVVRKGIDQVVVRSAFIPDNVFETYCETKLPRRTNAMLLDSLLSQSLVTRQQVAPLVQQTTLNKEQSIKAAQLAAQGIAPSNITKLLGYTSSKRYNEMIPIVSAIHKAVKTKQALLGRK